MLGILAAICRLPWCFWCGLCRLVLRGGACREVFGCRLRGGEAVLQAGVAELVDGSDCAQDAAAAGVFKKPYEANWGPVRCGELHEGEGG